MLNRYKEIIKKSNIKNIIIIIIIGLIIFEINQYFFQVCVVHGDSMHPTLKNGNIIFIKKFNLNIEYNDILVIKKGDKIIIKRVVGLPNDKINIDQYLFVNGQKKENLYIENSGDIKSEVLLKDNEYFVLGDNINYSIDSRFKEIGIIYKDEIIGKMINNK